MRFDALLGLSAFLLQACIAVPIRPPEPAPYQEDETGQLIPGETSRREIRTLFGDPSESFRSGRWWTFHKDRRLTTWLVAAGGGYSAAVGAGADQRQYTLIIEFDDAGFVRGSTVVTDKRPCSPGNAICYRNLHLSTDSGTESTIPIPPEHCAIYLYTDRQIGFREPVFWEIDGRRPILKLTSSGTFHRLDVVHGMHVVEVLAFSPDTYSDSGDFVCGPGARHYFQLRRHNERAWRLEPVDHEQGRADLRDYRLILLPDQPPEEDTE